MEVQRWRRRKKMVKKVRNMWLVLYFVLAGVYTLVSVFNPHGLFGTRVTDGLFLGALSGSLVALADLYANEYIRR